MKVLLVCCALFASIAPGAAAAPRPPRDTTPPSMPTGLRVTSVTEDSITLAWNPSTDDSGSIHHYVVSPGSWHPGTSTTRTVTGLVPGHTMTFRVSAVDAAGNDSGQSAPVTGTTAADVTAPTAPTGLRLTATTPSSVSLAWTGSTDRWSFSYQVLMDGQVLASSASASTRLRHLAPGSTHRFAVRARDNGGNVSAPSNELLVTLPASSDATAPSAPANLRASDAGDFCGGTILDWTPSTDNVDAGSEIEYEIYDDGRFFDLVTGGGGAFLYALDGTSTWSVIAVDRSGNSSAPSNPATLTVVADPALC